MAAARIRVDFAHGRSPVEVTFSADEGPMRVLVVDGDERAASVLAGRLMAEGFDVQLAESAAEALRAIAPGRALPSVVVAEAALPGDDGFELCAQIRADARTAFLPVLLLARDADETIKARAGDAGADDLLPRPVYVNDVVAIVQLLAGRDTVDNEFHCDADAIPVHRMLRALLSGVRAGRLSVRNGNLSFRDGRVVDASFEGVRGEDALRRILLFADGDYSVRFGPALSRAEFSVSVKELCNRYEPMVERWSALIQRSVPLAAVLAVDFAGLASRLHELPDEVNSIIRLFDGCRTVREVVLESGFAELTTLEATSRLYVIGVLAPVDSESVGDVEVPDFFEPETATSRLVELFGGAVPEQPEEPRRAAEDWAKETLMQGLSPELGAQLSAFNVKPVSDVVPVAESILPSAMEVFAAGAVELGDRSLEDAINASLVQDEEPVTEPVAASAEGEFDIDVTEAPAPVRRGRPALGALAITLGVIAVAVGLAMVLRRPEPAPAPVQLTQVVEVKAVAPAVVKAPEKVVAAKPRPTVEQGVALYEAGMIDDALPLLEEVVRNDEANFDGWLQLGTVRFDAGQNEAAQIATERALQLRPDDVRALMLLASIHIERGQHELADAQLQKIIELDPKSEYAAEARQLLARTRAPKSALKLE